MIYHCSHRVFSISPPRSSALGVDRAEWLAALCRPTREGHILRSGCFIIVELIKKNFSAFATFLQIIINFVELKECFMEQILPFFKRKVIINKFAYYDNR